MMILRRWLLTLVGSALVAALQPVSFAQGEPESPLKSELGSPFQIQGIPGLQGASTDGDIELTASYKIKRGTHEGELSVHSVVTPGWHTFSLTQKPGGTGQASKLVVDSADLANLKSLEFISSQPPKIETNEDSPVPMEQHEGEFTWTAPLLFNEGSNPEKASIEVSYSGQVCHTVCIPIRPPRKLTATFSGYIEPPTGEFAPKINELTWKAHLEPKVVAPGGKAKLVFEVTPKNGYHFYPLAYRIPKEGNFPTAIIVTNAGNWRRHAVRHSAPPKSVWSKELGRQKYYDEPTTFTIDLDVPKDAPAGPLTLSGVLAYQTCQEDRCHPTGGAQFKVTATVGAAAEAGEVPVAFTEVERKNLQDQVIKVANATPLPYGVIDYMSLASQLGLALLGGILLNFMPCVLPVLGLKILNFAQQGGKKRGKVLALNVVYTSGLIAVFLVLATLSAFLNFGWGQQFTQMWFKVTLLVMTFAFALSFLGVWEIPIPGFAGGEQANALQQEGYFGAFFKGVFTTILGVSCSGPFLGGVFGYTLTQPPLVTYLIFICVAVGMASPFLIISLVPQAQKLLPKPGEWMNTFKHLMGFVMLGVVVYLFSTLGKDYYIATLAMLTGVGFGLWWVGRVPGYEERSKQAWGWIGGVTAAVLIGFLSFQFLGPVERLYPWKHFSNAELATLQKGNKTVMLDFTASWCLNCQLNFRRAINTQKVKEAIEKNGVVAVEADWTEPNAELEAKLTELNSQSIPVLAIYPAGRPQDVIILRDLVSVKQVVEALEKAGPSEGVAKGQGTATAEAAKKKPRAG